MVPKSDAWGSAMQGPGFAFGTQNTQMKSVANPGARRLPPCVPYVSFGKEVSRARDVCLSSQHPGDRQEDCREFQASLGCTARHKTKQCTSDPSTSPLLRDTPELAT